MPAVVGRRAPKETEARPRGPKPPRWSAERRASRVISAFTRVLTRYGTQGASQAPGVPRHKRVHARLVTQDGTPNGCRCTRTFLGAPPTPRLGVSEARMQTPGAKTRRGKEEVCVLE